jgi:glycosyltransferase involved in cell wall biosynthesis
MTSAPNFSVIIPLHNGSNFIEATLESLSRQTVANFETIIVDDGSTDDGLDRVAAHPLPTVIARQDAMGVAVARNHGAALARGEWLAFVDQDDLWHESRLERISPVLRNSSERLILTTVRGFAVETDRTRLGESGALIEGMADVWVAHGAEVEALCGIKSALDLSGSDQETVFASADLLHRTLTPTTSFFIRNDYLRLIGGWSLHAKSVDDWWLMANAARIEPIRQVDQPTHLYRIHGEATSRVTNFWYPYATSLLALRFGAQFEKLESALSTDLVNATLHHLLLEILDSGEYHRSKDVRTFTRRMTGLLWPSGKADLDIIKAAVKRRMPKATLSSLRRLKTARGKLHR